MNQPQTPPETPLDASTADEALARRRFFAIQAVRLAGIVLLLLGIAVLAEVLGWPHAMGMVLIAAGAVGTFLAPMLLARRWSSRARR